MGKLYSTSQEYLEDYNDLRDGYYEYFVAGEHVNLQTIFSDRSGWIRVIEVDWDNNYHLNDEEVKDIKLSDVHINQLMTTHNEYNIMAKVDRFKWPFNEWLEYPFKMYVHNSMERFSSVTPAMDIKNSNLLSIDLNQPPVKTWQQPSENIGFGIDAGDTFLAYGDRNRNGFIQSFSGTGKGAVYVR